VDRTLFPEIFALTMFIVGFRPLARRVGVHANLWFLGWGIFLLYLCVLLFDAPHRLVTHLLAQWALLGAGLVFLLASGNIPKRRISWLLIAEIALPSMLLALLDVYQVTFAVLLVATCLLFLAPAVHMLARPRQRTMPVVYICACFAIFGIVMIPVALHATHAAQQASLTLVYLSTAYLYYVSADRHSRGVIAATAGFAAWGAICPLSIGIAHFFPAFTIDRVFLDLPVYFVVIGIMLTLLEEHVERTERLAMHDPLTDLPNRRMFEERLIATMEEARIHRTTVACLVIDVDNFKQINDTLGHEAGDQLLRALAVRLSWHMTPRDILARTGGDEFTALLAGVSDEHHLRFIAGAMMSAGSVPIIIDGKPVDLHISIGIALSPDHADDIDSLRRAADQAMYTAKRRGGSMLAFADEE
jgi:diguanylate cyclase (GGDEF)-like protein